MTRMMASTFVETKIRVNCIAPGIFPSEMTAGSSGEDQKSKLDMSMSNPAGRTGHDSDMAACILFLAGPGGLFLNSQVLYPDGGKSAPLLLTLGSSFVLNLLICVIGNILVQPAAT